MHNLHLNSMMQLVKSADSIQGGIFCKVHQQPYGKYIFAVSMPWEIVPGELCTQR